MKWFLLWCFTLAPCVICLTAAAWLAISGRDGWGWFLFVGLLLVPSMSSSTS